MEDITKHWSSLSLSEKEGSGLRLQKEQAIEEFAIAARFLTKRPLNIEAIANTFTPLWRSKSGFKIKNLGNHLMLFSFDNRGDIDRIIKTEPWSFDKHLMVLTQYDKDTTLNPIEMKKVAFWIQVFDIPVRFRNREVAEQICEAIGTIIHPLEAPDSDGGSFIRVRVLVDISLPLCRGRIITLENGREHWVSFKYERLPNLCYWCGLLTHGDKDCIKWIESEGSLQQKDQQYGSWLRAPPFLASRKNVINVPGFFAKKNKENSGHVSPDPPSQPPSVATGMASVSTPPPLSSFNANDFKTSNPENSGAQQSKSNSNFDSNLNSPPNRDFEELINEIDQEISCFDHAEAHQVESNGPLTKPVPSPSSLSPIHQPSPSKPLQDILNRPQTTPQAHEDKKWARIQRPSFLSEDQSPNISLGKRLLPPSFGDLSPAKRRASPYKGKNDNLSPTAAAALQPRRAQ